MKKQIGAATLIITMILLLSVAVIMFFSTQHTVLQQKINTNLYLSDAAFQAAEGGLEFGLVFLNNNIATVKANPVNGYINYGAANSNLTNVTLSNGSRFSVVYTNPIQNNYQLLQVTSTGTSADGTSTIVISQRVYQQENNVSYSAFSRGNVTLVGGSRLTNTINNLNISTGGTVTINNGAATYTASGLTSSQGNINSDIQQNVSSMSNMSENDFFQSIFGASKASVQSQAQAAGSYYNNAGPDYSQALNGKEGQIIYINQTNGTTATLGQGATIGSSSSPVTLIVNGSLTIANGVRIYGFVYSSGSGTGLTLAGGARIIGGIASGGKTDISNGVQVQYNKIPTLIGVASGAYAKVSGSWKDF